MQNDPGASICTRKISKLYIKETIEVMSKGHRRQFEGAPICQRWNNLSTQKNHDSNVLKHYKFIKIHEFITIVLKKSSLVSFGSCYGTNSEIILKIDQEKRANIDPWER